MFTAFALLAYSSPGTDGICIGGMERNGMRPYRVRQREFLFLSGNFGCALVFVHVTIRTNR